MTLVLPAIASGGGRTENVRGIGVGLDVHGVGQNPVYSAGLLHATFGIISYQARLTGSYRPSDNTTWVRAGVGAGAFYPILLNIDVTYQTGQANSAGMFVGLSAFLSGAVFTPEIFLGYQANFSGTSENFILAGAKGYLNFAEIK